MQAQKLTIVRTDTNLYTVIREDGRYCDKLCWDETIGECSLFVIAPDKQWRLHSPEETAVREARTSSYEKDSTAKQGGR